MNNKKRNILVVIIILFAIPVFSVFLIPGTGVAKEGTGISEILVSRYLRMLPFFIAYLFVAFAAIFLYNEIKKRF